MNHMVSKNKSWNTKKTETKHAVGWCACARVETVKKRAQGLCGALAQLCVDHVIQQLLSVSFEDMFLAQLLQRGADPGNLFCIAAAPWVLHLVRQHGDDSRQVLVFGVDPERLGQIPCDMVRPIRWRRLFATRCFHAPPRVCVCVW